MAALFVSVASSGIPPWPVEFFKISEQGSCEFDDLVNVVLIDAIRCASDV